MGCDDRGQCEKPGCSGSYYGGHTCNPKSATIRPNMPSGKPKISPPSGGSNVTNIHQDELDRHSAKLDRETKFALGRATDQQLKDELKERELTRTTEARLKKAAEDAKLKEAADILKAAGYKVVGPQDPDPYDYPHD